MKPVRIGCSGWSYQSWRGRLYPRDLPSSRWLEEYARHFPTVEVNNTFYRLPTIEAVETWARTVPEGFTFAVKGSRYLTHMKRLTDLGQGVERFYERIEPLLDRGLVTALLWQLPANFHLNLERLEAALVSLPQGRHAFEFRHPSWFCDDVYALLERHGAALVVGDHPDRPFQPHRLTADWTFVRFHWGWRGRRGNYSQSEIATWARRIAQWRRRAEVLAYFNNDWEGFAPRNARDLAARLS